MVNYSSTKWQNVKQEKDILFSKWCCEKWTAACKSMKLEHTLTSCTKINSKWLKDLNIRQDSIKLLEKNIGKTFSDINLTNVFLRSVSQGNKNKPVGPSQTYKLSQSKGNHKKQINKQTKTQRQPTEWEKIISNDATNKGLISKTYKQLIKQNSKKTSPLKNGKKA